MVGLHHDVPFPLLFCAMVLLFLVGLSNVAIYVTTRSVSFRRKTDAITSITTPHQGTQVEVYIDRVTQQDVGAITIGGTQITSRERSTVRFGDIKMDDIRGGEMAKAGDDSSSQNSWDRDVQDAKTPNSAVSASTSPPL
jgi:hypothetical protein